MTDEPGKALELLKGQTKKSAKKGTTKKTGHLGVIKRCSITAHLFETFKINHRFYRYKTEFLFVLSKNEVFSTFGIFAISFSWFHFHLSTNGLW